VSERADAGSLARRPPQLPEQLRASVCKRV